jgi:hypothetical protein
MKVAIGRYKSRMKRLPRYAPALFLAGAILLLRVAWLVNHSCIPIATQTLSISENLIYSGVAFSRDSQTFMIKDKDFLYQFDTKTTKILHKWPLWNVSHVIRQKDDPDKWVIRLDIRSSTQYKIFSVAAGGVIGDADEIESDWQMNPISADKRFVIRYLLPDDVKKLKLEAEKLEHTYKVYDYKTKKHVLVNMHRTPGGFYQPLFWPNAQTVCTRNTNNTLVLYDAETGNEVAFPVPLQARVKDIIYVNYYKSHHIVAFSDGTVESYKEDNFQVPVKRFKIAANAFVDRALHTVQNLGSYIYQPSNSHR